MFNATLRAAKAVFFVVLFGSFAVGSVATYAHPLGQGNCLPRYHHWRDATFELRDAKAALVNYRRQLAAAIAEGNIFNAINWSMVVLFQQIRIAWLEGEIETRYQTFLDCDHY